jgi:hypothetical protein
MPEERSARPGDLLSAVAALRMGDQREISDFTSGRILLVDDVRWCPLWRKHARPNTYLIIEAGLLRSWNVGERL